jgi:hypothetical protein
MEHISYNIDILSWKLREWQTISTDMVNFSIKTSSDILMEKICNDIFKMKNRDFMTDEDSITLAANHRRSHKWIMFKFIGFIKVSYGKIYYGSQFDEITEESRLLIFRVCQQDMSLKMKVLGDIVGTDIITIPDIVEEVLGDLIEQVAVKNMAQLNYDELKNELESGRYLIGLD